MARTVSYVRTAEKQLARIDRTWQKRIVDYLDDDVATLDDPRLRGKALAGELGGLWRYRVGDHRIICSIEESVKVILVVKIGHRRAIYE